jgi:glycosyltransferase involved in cell wall biosynthesis
VERLMADHDLFFLPTRGENFGHVIPEALSAGTPVLIADTTPWRGLVAAGVGWDLPLADEAGFVAAIEHAAAVPASEYAEWRQRARDYAAEGFSASDDVEANRRLFKDAVARGGRAEENEDPCLE